MLNGDGFVRRIGGIFGFRNGTAGRSRGFTTRTFVDAEMTGVQDDNVVTAGFRIVQFRGSQETDNVVSGGRLIHVQRLSDALGRCVNVPKIGVVFGGGIMKNVFVRIYFFGFVENEIVVGVTIAG